MTDERSFNTNIMIDFFSAAMAATTREEILTCLDRAAKAFGMDCFAISGIPSLDERIDPYFMLNAWPDGWFERYVENNYVHVDPVIYQTKTSSDAFVWSDALKDRPLRPKAKLVMNEATEYRMLDGFSVPLHGVNGFQAIVTFGAQKVDLSIEARGTLHMIAIFAHNRLKSLLSQNIERQKLAKLQVSHREQEVLLWLAAGKTNWEIGQILNLSDKTIKFYLAGLQRKLNAMNRTQMIAEAFRLGIIH